jgi:hypothetical protein
MNSGPEHEVLSHWVISQALGLILDYSIAVWFKGQEGARGKIEGLVRMDTVQAQVSASTQESSGVTQEPSLGA